MDQNTLPPIGGYENPFKLPSDDQIFRLREEEKLAKEEARKKSSTQSVWDKGTKKGKSRSERMEELLGDTTIMTLADTSGKKGDDNKNQVTMARRPEKENMAEFTCP